MQQCIMSTEYNYLRNKPLTLIPNNNEMLNITIVLCDILPPGCVTFCLLPARNQCVILVVVASIVCVFLSSLLIRSKAETVVIIIIISL
jgi:hypothetical protein